MTYNNSNGNIFRRRRIAPTIIGLSDGVDLREELHTILFGNIFFGPKGFYVTIKHYDKSKPTDNYDPITKEAIGPDPYESTTTRVVTYKRPVSVISNEEKKATPGLISTDTFYFYFEYTTTIDLNDYIYEYNSNQSTIRGTDTLPQSNNRYKVTGINNYRAEDGRLEYIMVVANLEHFGHS